MKKVSSISSIASNKESIFVPPQPPRSLFGGVSSIKSNKSLNGLKKSLHINSNNKFISEDSSQTSTIKNNNIKCNYFVFPIHSNLIKENLSNNENVIKNNNSNSNSNIKINNDVNFLVLNKIFYKMNKPNEEKEIELFVKNLIDYIDYMNSCSRKKIINNINALKIRIEVRYNDYINNGLMKDYFLICLIRMQNELVSLICKYNDSLIKESICENN